MSFIKLLINVTESKICTLDQMCKTYSTLLSIICFDAPIPFDGRGKSQIYHFLRIIQSLSSIKSLLRVILASLGISAQSFRVVFPFPFPRGSLVVHDFIAIYKKWMLYKWVIGLSTSSSLMFQALHESCFILPSYPDF